MKSKVYFVPVKDADDIKRVSERLKALLASSGVMDFIREEDKIAVKAHFGEEGNTGYVRAEYAGVICRDIISRGAKPFLSDTNTLYKGKRTNPKDHLDLAKSHGFTKEITGCKVIIPDDTNKEDTLDVPVNGKLVKTAKLARIFVEADGIVAINHFKGHMLSGFGGAIKNIAMGCAMREGKMMQHCDVCPEVNEENCIGCGECVKICPANAIIIVSQKANVDGKKCIGCGNCAAVCPTWAMFVFSSSGESVQKKMVEYAYAALKGKAKKRAFINFAVKINKECDCWGMENPRIGPDIGILASSDPVSVDRACFDLVMKTCGKNIFKEAHPEQNSQIQLNYAKALGLGSLEYELLEA
ncbi:MAG: DUF362 domain-containing protein [Candidatus Omnitrophica bacterium]|nr:DUF362 domain-containing protein [Candidatus Omnitrophota bacterium]